MSRVRGDQLGKCLPKLPGRREKLIQFHMNIFWERKPISERPITVEALGELGGDGWSLSNSNHGSHTGLGTANSSPLAHLNLPTIPLGTGHGKDNGDNDHRRGGLELIFFSRNKYPKKRKELFIVKYSYDTEAHLNRINSILFV